MQMAEGRGRIERARRRAPAIADIAGAGAAFVVGGIEIADQGLAHR